MINLRFTFLTQKNCEQMRLGMQEILIIALVILLLFGGKKIPELMKGLGKGVKSFKDGLNEQEDKSQNQQTIEKDKGK